MDKKGATTAEADSWQAAATAPASDDAEVAAISGAMGRFENILVGIDEFSLSVTGRLPGDRPHTLGYRGTRLAF